MKFRYIAFIWSAFVLIDSLVEGLKCYKCDSDDDKNCTESNVPYSSSAVEICDRYPRLTPRCRISIYYEWTTSGERILTHVYRTGCNYGGTRVSDGCTSEKFGPLLGATTCLCSNKELCNQFMLQPNTGGAENIAGNRPIVTFAVLLVLCTNLQQILPEL